MPKGGTFPEETSPVQMTCKSALQVSCSAWLPE